MGANECFMQTEFGLGASGHVTKIYKPKMGKKLTSLNRCISVITDIDEKWFEVIEYTINHLSFGYVRLPDLNPIFLVLHLFPYFFFFFFCRYLLLKPQNELYCKFERLEISQTTCVRLKLRLPDWGNPLKRGRQILELLSH